MQLDDMQEDDKDKIIKTFKAIYRQYFKVNKVGQNATCPFVPEDVRANIEQNYRCKPSIDKNLYDEAYHHATRFLEPCYTNFLKSDIFIRYVEECRNEISNTKKVQTTIDTSTASTDLPKKEPEKCQNDLNSVVLKDLEPSSKLPDIPEDQQSQASTIAMNTLGRQFQPKIKEKETLGNIHINPVEMGPIDESKKEKPQPVKAFRPKGI